MSDKKQKLLNQFYYKRNIFRLIEGYVHIVRCNGITKAANKMDLSPSVVSTQLKVLEKEFGVRLIKRKRGGKFITLTKEGQKFYDAVNRIFVALDETIENFHRDFVESRNTVRIACHPLISKILLPQAVQELYKIKPDVKIEMNEITYDAAISAIQDGEVDIALYPKDLDIVAKEKGIKCTKLFKYHPTVFCHPKHPVAEMNEKDIRFEHFTQGFVMSSEVRLVVDETKLRYDVHVKSSFHNILNMVNIINGITCLDRRISIAQDCTNLIIKDTPQLTQTSWFFAIQSNDIEEDIKEKIDMIFDIVSKQAKMID